MTRSSLEYCTVMAFVDLSKLQANRGATICRVKIPTSVRHASPVRITLAYLWAAGIRMAGSGVKRPAPRTANGPRLKPLLILKTAKYADSIW